MRLSDKGEATQPKFGCHCDIEGTGSEPDECVFDNGDIDYCVYATALQREGKGKLACEWWKPIKPPERPVPMSQSEAYEAGYAAAHARGVAAGLERAIFAMESRSCDCNKLVHDELVKIRAAQEGES